MLTSRKRFVIRHWQLFLKSSNFYQPVTNDAAKTIVVELIKQDTYRVNGVEGFFEVYENWPNIPHEYRPILIPLSPNVNMPIFSSLFSYFCYSTS